jgi:hypothetical protein
MTSKEIAMIDQKEPSTAEISRIAYALYLERGCEPGRDVEDWIRAEKELEAEPIVTPAKTRVARRAQTS